MRRADDADINEERVIVTYAAHLAGIAIEREPTAARTRDGACGGA